VGARQGRDAKSEKPTFSSVGAIRQIGGPDGEALLLLPLCRRVGVALVGSFCGHGKVVGVSQKFGWAGLGWERQTRAEVRQPWQSGARHRIDGGGEGRMMIAQYNMERKVSRALALGIAMLLPGAAKHSYSMRVRRGHVQPAMGAKLVLFPVV
jgi:hypothetical protein